MKSICILLLSFLMVGNVLAQTTEITADPNDNFVYDGETLHHYGVGFHRYLDGLNGTNLYGSGFFGIDLFTGGLNRLRISRWGYVGLGTVAPTQKLDVEGNIKIGTIAEGSLLHFYGKQGTSWGYYFDNREQNALVIKSQYENTKPFAIDPFGNVGIGITTPVAQLHLEDIYDAGGKNLLIGDDSYLTDIDLGNTLGIYGNQDNKIGNIRLGALGPTLSGRNGELGIDYSISIGQYRDKMGWDGTGEQPGYHIRFAGYRDVAGSFTGARISALRTNLCCNGLAQGMELAFYVTNSPEWNSNGDVNLKEAMRINDNGNIAIGKSKADVKLDVVGTIRANEIKVEAATTAQLNVDGTLHANTIKVAANGQTADFVFGEDYELKKLEKVEAYISEHKHLPDVPSAQQMEKEGVDLAEMNKLLLQKVEELTLYVIQLQKSLEEKDQRLKLVESSLEIKK